VTPDRTHIVNMGSMVEAMEGDLRGAMNELYIGKVRWEERGRWSAGACVDTLCCYSYTP
jgi:hypothetical protein